MMCSNGTLWDCNREPNVGLALMALTLGVVLALSLAMNGVICLVFYKKSYLLSVSNSFVLNLSCCQLCLSVFVIPFVLASIFSTTWTFDNTFCKVQGYFFTICVIAIQFSLMIISIDRNYAIINSLRYPYIFTSRLGNALIGGAWMLSFLFALPPLVGWGSYSYMSDQYLCAINLQSGKDYSISLYTVCFLVPLLIQSWCYLSIFKAAVGHTKRRSRVFPSMPNAIRDPPSNSSGSSDASESIQVQYRNVECKAVRTILLIAIAYALCWVPYLTVSIGDLSGDTHSSEVKSFAVCLVFCTGIVNPIIYAFMNRVTRHEINKFFCDTISKVNGRTTTNDSDEFYSTTMTTYSSSKQNVVVWTTQKSRGRKSSARNMEMSTIEEVREMSTIQESRDISSPKLTVDNKSHTLLYDKCNKQEHSAHRDHGSSPCMSKEQISQASSRESLSAFNDNETAQSQRRTYMSEGEPSYKPIDKRNRAHSEFLSRGEKFISQTHKDCGSFLLFENKQVDYRFNRKRANSHFLSSTTFPSRRNFFHGLMKTENELPEVKESEQEVTREMVKSEPSVRRDMTMTFSSEGRQRAQTVGHSAIHKSKFLKDKIFQKPRDE